MWHVSRAVALASALSLVSGVAYASKLTDAEELFRRAKALMAENKHAEACPLLEESERLDPQMGTLLNLAICHETIGRIVSAWGEFRAVEQQVRAVNREDRVKLAHDRAAKLEPRLPRMKVVVPADAAVPGLELKVDGEVKGEPLWGGFAVDPGFHTVEVSAPGKKPATLKVKIEQEGAVVPVTLPKLEDEPVEPVGPTNPETPRNRDAEYAKNRSHRTVGLIVGGAGIATMAVGGVFGLLAIGANGDAADACPSPCVAGSSRAAEADASTDRALVFANVANVVVPVGLIATAVGAYMFLTAGPTGAPKSTTGVLTPRPGGAGFTVQW